MTDLQQPNQILVQSGSQHKNDEEMELQHVTEMKKLQSKPTEKDSKKCSLDFIWKNINIKLNKKKTEDQISLLTNLNGRVKGGECLAILGSSGAGKTTDFIPVNPGDILQLTANAQWSGRCYAFYDTDKTKLFVYPDTTESLKN